MEQKIDLFEDGRAIIFRKKVRGKINPVWQAYITTSGSTGRIRKSTGAQDQKRAEQIARDLLIKAEGRLEAGLPLNPIRFDDACDQYLRNLKRSLEADRINQNNYDRQMAIITGFIKPYFGSKLLHTITPLDIENYHLDRKSGGVIAGKSVKSGTINKDNSFLRGIFKFAKKSGYISEIPTIENQQGGKQRKSVTRDEMKHLQSRLQDWIKPHKYDAPHVFDYRQLFAFYINVLQYSGLRPGKEMASLRWPNVEYRKADDGQEYVRLICVRSKQKAPEKRGKVRRVVAVGENDAKIINGVGLALAINIESMMEMDPPIIQNYFDLLRAGPDDTTAFYC